MDKKITEKELETLKKLTGEFNTIKAQLGDLTLQEYSLCMKVEEVKKEFGILEADLSEKYGKDSVINLETGVVTKKEETIEEVEEIKEDAKDK
mgnify:CR=1 FL=1